MLETTKLENSNGACNFVPYFWAFVAIYIFFNGARHFQPCLRITYVHVLKNFTFYLHLSAIFDMYIALLCKYNETLLLACGFLLNIGFVPNRIVFI